MIRLWSRAATAAVVHRRARAAVGVALRPLDCCAPPAAVLHAACSVHLSRTHPLLGGAVGRQRRAQPAAPEGAKAPATAAAAAPVMPQQPAAQSPRAGRGAAAKGRGRGKGRGKGRGGGKVEGRASGAPPLEVSAAPAATVEIDAAELLKEWGEVQRRSGDGGRGGQRPADAPMDAAATTRHAGPVGDRAAVLSAVLHHPSRFPRLHDLFFMGADNEEDVLPAITFTGVGAAVLREADLRALLVVARLRCQTSRQTAPTAAVGQQLNAAVLDAVAAAWTEAAARGDASSLAEVARAVALVLLEVRKEQFSQLSRGAPAAGGKRTTAANRRRQGGGAEWPADDVARFVRETAAPLAAAAAAAAPPAIADVVTALALQLLAADVGGALPALGGGDAAGAAHARAAGAAVQKELQMRLQSAARCDFATVELAACDAAISEVLDALVVSRTFDMALPPAAKTAVHAGALRTVQQLCHTVKQRPHLFLALCRPEVAASLNRLQDAPGGLYEQLCTDIFSAATAFLSAGDADAIARLVEEREAARLALLPPDYGAPPRPPLHSALSQMCYMLMCTGFSPLSVWNSSLCVAPPAVDAVDISRASSLFSAAFAARPLPPRVRAALRTDALELPRQALQKTRQVVQSATELLLQDTSGLPRLATRLEAGANVKPPAAQPQRRRTAKGRERGRAAALRVSASEATDAVGQALYVALSALVECITRGDEASTDAITQAVLPLLEAEGGAAYLVEALEHLSRGVGERLLTAGGLEPLEAAAAAERRAADLTAAATASATTTLQMEECLVTAACAFQTRLVDCIARREGQAAAPEGGGEAEEAMRLVLRFTACALSFGLKTGYGEQLATLHATLRAAGGAAPDDPVEAFRVVRQMDQLLNGLVDSRLPARRHPQSAHVRGSSGTLNNIVAVQLHTTATAAAELTTARLAPPPAAPGDAEGDDAAAAARQGHRLVLAVVHLLFRLATDHAVETEPAKLQSYRTNILDGALTTVLDDPLPLTTLAEVAVVMCTPHTIHRVSQPLCESLARSVATAAAALPPPTAVPSHATSVLSQRLLSAAAVVCLRDSAPFTEAFVHIAEVLAPRLTTRHAAAVLDAALARQAPLTSAPLRRLAQQLMAALDTVALSATTAAAPARRPAMTVGDATAALSTLCECDERTGGAAPVGAVLLRICSAERLRRRPLTPRQCGRLARVAVSMAERPAAMAPHTAAEQAAILRLPRTLAAAVLKTTQGGSPHDVPAVLSGYARVPDAALREQVLRAMIARAIRACPALAPAEVVECVEAYCRAGMYHEYLFSVLLGRVADVTQRFSLDLALRLLRCGTDASSPQVRMACLTAAQPVFTAHVRHLLQSDPQHLATVGATSTKILACLRECFPHDAISAAVLECIALHHKTAEIATVKAALRLAAARGSRDLELLRTLSAHCTDDVMPTCSPEDLADLVDLLVQCGVRSSALVIAASSRFRDVASKTGGGALARLASGLERASADADAEVTALVVDRTTALVDAFLDGAAAARAGGQGRGRGRGRGAAIAAAASAAPPFAVADVAVLLSYLRSTGRTQFALVAPAVDALLAYATVLWSLPGQSGGAGTPFTADALTPDSCEVVLGALVELATRPAEHAALVDQVAQQVSFSLAAQQPHDTAAAGAGAAWTDDIALLANLTNNLARAAPASRAAVAEALRRLCDCLYERRALLLRRRLVLDTARLAMTAAGEELHPQLHALVVAPTPP